MKKFAYLIAAITMGSMSSCVEFPDLPNDEVNIVIRNVDIEIPFSAGNFGFTPIDVNNNGSADYMFMGLEDTEEEGVEIHVAGLVSAYEENTVMVLNTTSSLCTEDLGIGAARSLGINTIIDGNSMWDNQSLFYVHLAIENSCTEYVKFIDYGVQRFIGIQFQDEGDTYFGYLRIMAIDNSEVGLEDCADVWKISQIVYSSFPNTGLRTPASS